MAGQYIDIYSAFIDLIEAMRKGDFKAHSYAQKHYIAQSLYTKIYGLNDGNPSARGDDFPLDLIRMNSKEGHLNGGLFGRRAREFQQYKVGPTFNISLFEWLELPRAKLLETLEICKESDRRRQENSGLLNKLYKLLESGDPDIKKLLE